MEGPSKAEMAKTIDSFIDPIESDLPLIDRSTAENYDCPYKGKAIEEGRASPVGLLAESGNAVHDAYSGAVLEWVASRGAIDPPDIRNEIEFGLRNSRPDVQPEALRAGRPSIWSWSKFISDIHPENILAFDGGESVGKGGQFAWDLPDLGVRFTSEIDLLYTDASPLVLNEVDYKSGWKPWTAAGVRDSFQFQSHAVLVLQKYPSIECLTVQVWSTRANRTTYRVDFTRKNLPDYQFRIRRMLQTRKRHWDNPPCWPWDDKCRTCPAAATCPVAYGPIKTAADKPEEILKDLIAVYGRAEALETILKAQVKRLGHDIKCGHTYFGNQKPKAEKAAPVTMYEIKTKEQSNGDSSDAE